MPITPPVRTILLNDHKDLVEAELHFPKGYMLAGRESSPDCGERREWLIRRH